MDQMSDYLLHRLDEAKEASADQHLAECDLCCDALERLSRQIDQGDTELEGANKRHEEVKAQLDASGQEVEVPRTTRPIKIWMRVAAVIIVILLPLSFLFVPSSPEDNMALFIAYYEPYEDMLTVRSGETVDNISQALTEYNRGNFAEAARLLESIPAEETTTTVKLFTGIAHLEANALPKAQAKLREVADAPGLLKGPAAWYLALAHLKAGELKEASAALDRIPSSDAPHHRQAEELKEAIEKLTSEVPDEQ